MHLEDRIVISGISGRLPESNNVEEFGEYLFSGVDLITEDDRRWTPGLFGTSSKNGKLKNIQQFDASFFGIHSKLANVMDPQGRLLLEACHEAIVDAGINPQNLRGSRTGVFIGISQCESLDYWCSTPERVNGYGLIGCARSMISNRISFTFDFTGPSYSVDCACSSGITGLQHAFNAIQTDQCDAAIVGGVNLCMMPTHEMQYQKRNMISQKGCCSVFDEMCDGFVRSEAIVALFVQKRCDALRLYATIINIKTNSDGYKPGGFISPSSERQKELIREVYSEVAVNPAKVSYVEAHGIGLKDADCVEANTIDEMFCEERDSPLLIGSVKSNMGHSESASGLAAVVKVIVSMEKEMIPPNIHFNKPNSQISGLLNGRLKVVDKPTAWSGGLAGVNCFGIGGSNVHALLEWNTISKDKTPVVDGSPRIVVFSGRTEDGINRSLEKIEKMPINDEFISLLYNVHQNNIPGHKYRGFTLLGDATPVREVLHYNGEKRPLWFVFSGMGSQWAGMAKDMMKLPVFRDSIHKCAEVLKPEGVNLYDVVIDSSEETFKSIVNPFIGNAAVQIALVDVLRSVGITPDGIVGHSTGEIGCAYADGTLTAEQTMLAAYYRGKSVLDTELPLGAMAAVGLSFENAKKRMPPEIDIACDNSRDNVTLSGPAHELRKFVKYLQEEGIFAKEVNCSEISFHSRYILPAAPLLEKRLKEVIPHPKKRSERWISSSVMQSMWHTPLAQYSSAEYHVNNLLSPVMFQEAATHIPDNAIVIEVGPHCLLQAILKRSLPSSCTNIGLMKKFHPNNIAYLFSSFGKMYNVGLHPVLSVLLPTISYPVSRGTPMIAPLVEWDHSDEWTVASYDKKDTSWIGERIEEIDLSEDEHKFLNDHVVDGRTLFPATGLLELVWKTFASMNNEKEYHNFPVVFENLKFHRVTAVSREAPVKYLIKIFDGTGAFEVCTSGCLSVSGRIYAPDNMDKEMLEPVFPIEELASDEYPALTSSDIYKDLRQRGYDYGEAFKGIANADNQCLSGELTWNRNWVTFIETMLQFSILQKNSRELLLPKMIQKIIINADMQNVLTDGTLVPVHFYQHFGITKAGGVEIHRLKTIIIPRIHQDSNQPKLEKCCFIPYNNEQTELRNTPVNEYALPLLLQIILENVDTKQKINLLAFADKLKSTKPLFERVVCILKETEPMINAQCTVVCNDPEEYSAYNNLPSTIFVQRDSAAEEFATKDIHITLVSNTQNSFSEKLRYFTQLIKDGAFVLLKDSSLLDSSVVMKAGLDIVSVQRDAENVYTLLRKPKDFKNSVMVQVTENNFNWLRVLKNELKEAEKHGFRIVLMCHGEVLNGIVGLVQCIRQEPGGHNVRCMFIPDISVSAFSNTNTMYMSQLKKDLTINIYSEGKWGSYRHIKMADYDESTFTEMEHAYIDVMNSGDLETLRWLESPLTHFFQLANTGSKMCTVYYAPINAEDVMLATGKYNAEDYAAGFGSQKCALGLEFSGRDQYGCRVMGLVDAGGLATSVVADSGFIWEVPESWSLEEAATVPSVYATSYYALIVCGRMKPGETLLVHAGSGGVGQASISIALDMGVTVFTTVGTPEKRNFLKQRFPQLTDNNIFNSRDTTFEKHVMNQTRGRGVDLVLNSLAEDKLQASVRCLANSGRFLEIGKMDIVNNNPLGMSVFLKNTAFHGINFKSLFRLDRHEKQEVVKLFTAGINSGLVRPLPRSIFSHNEAEKAFRYLATGKHIGKVMLKIRTEEVEKVVMPLVNLVPAIPRSYMFPYKVYIVTEGLSDIGLQLVEWLVIRGATKIVLTSRSNIKTGYQYLCIRRWRELGIIVSMSDENFSTEKDTLTFLNDVKKMGDIGGIFNISQFLKNDVFENLAEEKFYSVCQSTVNLIKNLDTLSRLTCPKLDHFVIFSSVLRSYRNNDQPTYGLANSVMERICEARQSVGLPALVVQWGAIGDVSLVAETMPDATNNRVTFAQHISSCLHTLDNLLHQTHPVVSSLVMVENEVGPRHLEILDGMANFLGIQKAEKGLKMAKETVVKLASKAEEGSDQPPLFLVHPVEGVITSLEPLSAELTLPVWGLQCTPEAPLASIQQLAAFYVQHVKRIYPNGPYNLGGYSFGATVAFEMALQLEKMGKQVTLILIDGSPSWLSAYIEHLRPADETPDNNKDEFLALAYFLSQYLDLKIREVRKFLRTVSNWDELAKLLAHRSPCTTEQVVSSVDSLHKRIVSALTYTPKDIFMGSVVLFKANTQISDMENDSNFSKVCQGKVEAYTLDTHHKKILQKSCIKKMTSVISLENSFSKVRP